MGQSENKTNGEGETAETLDMTDGRDRALMRRAVNERWPMPMAKRVKIVEKLMTIAAGEEEGEKDSRAVTSAARTLARMDAINQADEHADRAYERIDDGKATERVDVICVKNDLV